jgi:hypothetical protein
MSNETTTYTSGRYCIEMFRGNNWMPWKRRMLAVLHDQQLYMYIESNVKPPTLQVLELTKPEEIAAKLKEINQWHKIVSNILDVK